MLYEIEIIGNCHVNKNSGNYSLELTSWYRSSLRLPETTEKETTEILFSRRMITNLNRSLGSTVKRLKGCLSKGITIELLQENLSLRNRALVLYRQATIKRYMLRQEITLTACGGSIATTGTGLTPGFMIFSLSNLGRCSFSSFSYPWNLLQELSFLSLWILVLYRGSSLLLILVEHHLSFFFYFYILEELSFHLFIFSTLGFL